MVSLDRLIKDWLAEDSELSPHFTIVIDNLHQSAPAYITSSIDTICHRRPVRIRRQPLPYPFQRYMDSQDVFHRPIAFILNDRVKLHRGHCIGVKKELELLATDQDFFAKLKNIMYLMHKVQFGKSCELKPSNL